MRLIAAWPRTIRPTNALNFTGGGMSINLGSLSAAGGCTGAASFCNTALTYSAAGHQSLLCSRWRPHHVVRSEPHPPRQMRSSNSAAQDRALVAYTAATPCTNDGFKTKGNTACTLAAGGVLHIRYSDPQRRLPITGTGVTFILLPGATIDTKGGGTLTITAPTTAPSTSSLPAALQPDASLFQNMAIYDASATAVQFGGNSNINLTGNIYAPNAE